MKSRSFIMFVVVALVAGAVGWFSARRSTEAPKAEAGRKLLFYQSSMHPWIKSDKPGNCTICGMALTPVYEGEQGANLDPNLVTLSSNSVTVTGIATEPVERKTLTRRLRFTGVVEDDETKHRMLSSYIEGRVEKLHVSYSGAEVKEGEALASIYSPQLLSLEREYQSLRQRAGATNSSLFKEHERLLVGITERLLRLGLNSEQIEALADKPATQRVSTVHAPISGTVINRFVFEGQYVKEGDKLFELGDFSRMWFMFDVYEQDLSEVRPGVEVAVTLNGKTYRGKVGFINPTLNNTTRSARARVEIENPPVAGGQGREISHLLYGSALLEVTTADVLAVSRTALIQTGNGAMVYVEKGPGAYEPRKVELGRRGDEEWEVLKGLEAGEMVVVRGNFLLDSQAQINATARPIEAIAERHGTSEVPGHLHLSDTELGTAGEIFKLASSLNKALAADDFPAANTAMMAVINFTGVASKANASTGQLTRLTTTMRVAEATNLAGLRKAAHPFITESAKLLLALQKSGQTNLSFHVFRCPMVNRAVPGAPARGDWLQVEAELRNPFFGAEMLECGSEVRP